MARFNKGWVKAWREMIDGDLPDNVWLWGIWHWLLYSAHWKPSKILWNGKQREIPAGTVVMGMTELATKWNCSINTIKRWLRYLEETERVYIETCTRGTLITIRNWELYQSQDQDECTPTANKLHTDCKQTANEVQLIEEVKKERRVVNPTQTTLLWNHYKEELKKQKQIEAVKSGKTNSICKSLVEEFGLEKSKDLVLEFLKDKDPFVVDAAFPVGLLYSQRQKYLARLGKSSRTQGFAFDDLTSEVRHA